jgi:hypothetical protein
LAFFLNLNIRTFPPPELSEEESLMHDFRDAHQNLPKPRHHLAAPVPDSIPAPPKFSPSTSALYTSSSEETCKSGDTKSTHKTPKVTINLAEDFTSKPGNLDRRGQETFAN